MKITAIDATTGRVLMSQAGSMDEANFRRTVAASFPGVAADKLVIVVDGRISQPGMPANRSTRAPKSSSVIWKGSYTDLGGYANMNREIVSRLPAHGFAVKVDMLATAQQVDGTTHAFLRALESIRLPDEATCPMVVGFTPMPIQKGRRKVIFFTMMETQGLHAEFVNRCNAHANEIWVPCGFYERAFRKSGIVRPIFKIPLGVNHHSYVPDAKEPELTYEAMPSGERTRQLPDAFRFISLFGWSMRKGADVLCKSFLKEFDGTDDAILVIYSRYMGSSAEVHKEHVRAQIREYYAALRKDVPAKIYYCGDEVPIANLPGCYAAADAFVFCSRGEGFALPLVEAGACGLPIISAYNTAMTEYLDDEVAYCVAPEAYAPANELTWISGYYRDQDFAVYGDQSVEAFGRHMRHVLSHGDEAKAKAEKFRKRVLDTYTWDACAARVATRLRGS